MSSSNALVFVFVLCIVQSMCGPLKIKSPEVLKLVNDVELARNNVEMQLKLQELNSKTAIKTAGYTAKLELKQFETVVKSVTDPACLLVARSSLKAAEQTQGELKTCHSKDGAKLLKVQITSFLKTLQSQAYSVEGYCNLMHKEAAEVELCIETAIAAIREQLSNTETFASSSIEAITKNEEECIGNTQQKLRDAISEGTANIDACENPTTPKEESEESNESNSGSAESGEQGATEGGAQEGGEGPVEGSEAPVEGSEAPVEGSEAPVEGSEAPVEGSEAPVEGSEAPAEGSEAPAEGSESPAEGSDAPAEGSDAPVEGSEAPVEGSEAPAEGEATAAQEETGGAATEGAAAEEGSGNAGEIEEGENVQEPTEEAQNQNGGEEQVPEDGENAATEKVEVPQEPAQ